MQNTFYDKPTAIWPLDALVRLKQIIGPGGLLPISKSKFYSEIRKGAYPSPLKLGRVSVWKAEDIHAIIENAEKDGRAS